MRVLLCLAACCLAAAQTGNPNAAATAATPALVQNLLSVPQPVFNPANGLSINELLCAYSPGTDPRDTYPGVATGSPINLPPGSLSGYGRVSTTNVYTSFTGNQTNNRNLNYLPTNITSGAATVCSTSSGVTGNALLACQQGAGWAYWPAGVNPVPAGTVLQGVVVYSIARNLVVLMDTHFPFATVVVNGAGCVGWMNGVADGMLMQLTLPTSGNLIISGPTSSDYFGWGGANELLGWSGVSDNQWILTMNLRSGVCSTASPPVCWSALGGGCPGLSLLSGAYANPYSPTGGLSQCGPPQNTSNTLVSTTFPTSPSTAPPPPRTSFALPASIAVPSSCMTVEEYLCQFTSDAYTINNVAAPNGLTPAGSLCGVLMFISNIATAFLQDPFSPFATIKLVTGNQMNNTDAAQGFVSSTGRPPLSVNADGSYDYVNIGADAGYAVGDYVMVSFSSTTLFQLNISSSLRTSLFQAALNGVYWNDQFCDYTAPGVTLSSCPISTCQMAACGPRNIEASYGADYCTGRTWATGVNVANTVGCGVQILARNWPVFGPGPPSHPTSSVVVTSPLLNLGSTQCPDSAKPANLAPNTVVYVNSTVAVASYTASAFMTSGGMSSFAAAIAQVIIVSGPSANILGTPAQAGLVILPANVTVTSVTDAPSSLVGRRLLQTTPWALVSYTVAMPSQYSQSVRTYLSVLTEGLAFAVLLRGQGLLFSTDTELIAAPLFSLVPPSITNLSPLPPAPAPPPPVPPLPSPLSSLPSCPSAGVPANGASNGTCYVGSYVMVPPSTPPAAVCSCRCDSFVGGFGASFLTDCTAQACTATYSTKCGQAQHVAPVFVPWSTWLANNTLGAPGAALLATPVPVGQVCASIVINCTYLASELLGAGVCPDYAWRGGRQRWHRTALGG